jgi:tuftelin-interacting protein 11
MKFDEDDDEFLPFEVKADLKAKSLGSSKAKKKKFNAWEGEYEDDDDEDAVPAHLQFVDESSGGMFVKAGGLADQLKKKPVAASSGSGGGGEKSAKKAKKMEKKPVVKDKGKFGVGLSLLEKMGWTGEGGLGKKGTGITEALDVKMRPHGAGLGMIEEKTEAQKRVERQRRGEEVSEEEEEEQEAAKMPKMPAVDRSQRWKRSAAAAPKVQVKSAYDVLREEGAAATPQKLTIIDLTGERERVVTDPKQLYSKERAATDYKVGMGKELRFNVDKLLDMAETELKRQHRTEEQLRKKVETFGGQARALAKTVEEAETRLALLREAETLVVRLVQAAGDMAAAAETSDVAMERLVASLHQAFVGARARFGTELYAGLQLPDLLFVLLDKALTAYFLRGDIREQPGRGRRMAELLKDLLETYEARGRSASEEAVDYWMVLQTAVIVPPLRAYLMREWDCKRDPGVAVAALAAWSGALDEDVLHYVLHQAVWPRLLRCVEAWDPFTDAVPLHSWLHPWLPLLAREMEQTLYPIIVGKLVLALSEWEPEDGSAYALLQPWRTCFTAQQLDTVAQTRLLPKLSSFVSAKLKLLPGQQEQGGVLEAVLMWHDWIPSREFVKLLARTVFPRIYRSAFQWVTTSRPSPSGAQVVAWYKQLKECFPRELFANQKVCVLFAHLLDVLLNVMVGHVVDFEPDVLLVDLWADEREAAASSSGAHLPLHKPVVTGSGADAMSFRAMVEAFASERGILFMPLPNRKTKDGKPVYSFGGVAVHFANQLVYAELQPGAWTMVSLEHLAQLVQKSEVD